MKKFSAIVLVSFLMFSVLTVPVLANKSNNLAGDFRDINNHWAYEQMSELIAMGILKGYGQTADSSMGVNTALYAKPNNKITRAEFAALLYQALNLKPESEKAPFKDEVPSWAADPVNALYKNGIIKGSPDGNFRGGKYITRAEIATMLVRALHNPDSGKGKKFSDVPSWYWAYENIQIASAASLINGFPGGKFLPDRSAKRAEVMAMLYQFMTNDKGTLPDDSSLLASSDNVLKTIANSINGTTSVALSDIAAYLTGEMETLLDYTEAALNELKQKGNLTYSVNYPGKVVKKSGRWAEVVYETTANFKNNDLNLAQKSQQHYYMMKIDDRWYIYSESDKILE
jgi:hypothetical protein